MNFQHLGTNYQYHDHDQKYAPGEMGLRPLTDVDAPPSPPTPSSRRRKGLRRTIWALAALAIFHLSFKSFGCSLANGASNVFKSPVAVQSYHGIPLPLDVSVERCLPWIPLDEPEDARYFHETTSFSVPIVGIPEFFVLREGGPVPVVTKIHQTDEISGSKNAGVEVYLKTEQEAILDQVEICLLTKEGGGRGFSVAGRYPQNTRVNDTKVELIISIPKTSSETLELHDLIVELDFGIIELKDLDSVTFQDARLSLQAGLINSTSFTSRTITAKTVGIIDGNYTFYKEGTFKVATGTIEIVPTLLSLGGENVKLDVSTLAGKISVLASLLVDGESGSAYLGSEDGIFAIEAASSVGSIDLGFDQVSANAFVDVSTQTSFGESSVRMHPSFEGRFEIQTSLPWARPVVVIDDVEDPSGQRRKRGFSKNQSRRGTTSGNIWWGEEKEQGTVVMKTKVGMMRLAF